MRTPRNALLGACLALPLFAAAGHAQTVAARGRTIYVPPGTVVVILPGTAAAPVDMPPVAAPVADTRAGVPIMQLIAQQQAAMQHMIASMNAMFAPMPNPSGLFRAAFGNGPMLTLAAGPGVCSESISIVQHGDGAPVITRSVAGACGAPAAGKPESVRQLPPAPVQPQHGPQVLEISDPPHVMRNVPPHT